uniref:Uncharacterized protein n=1 Tax=Anguilla anguilla TaxID=7936 RepID=A0A0E9X3L3_ANGAN
MKRGIHQTLSLVNFSNAQIFILICCRTGLSRVIRQALIARPQNSLPQFKASCSFSDAKQRTLVRVAPHIWPSFGSFLNY